jgi:hypothetical protein
MFRAVFSLAKKLSADRPCVVFIDEVLLVLIFICNLSLSELRAREQSKKSLAFLSFYKSC